MKVCQSCKETKPLDEFHRRSKAKDGRQNRCKLCNRAQRVAYYKTAQGKESNVLVGKRTIEQNRRRIFEYLLEHSCIDCGEADPVVLEFDHREPSLKEFNIGRQIHCSWAKILREIEKCDVRCANCHRRRTANQFAWKKLAWYNELGA